MAPERKVNFPFGSIDLGFAKGDREADRSIEQQVVICEVVHVSEIRIYVQAEFPHEPFRHAKFVVVPMRRLYRQAQHVGVQNHNVGGTRQQDVFKRGSLKNPVISGMDQELTLGEVARNSQARTNCILVDDELVVVPANACTDGPITETDQVLNESGLLQVRPIAHKAEPSRRTRVELRGVGDYVGKVLVQEDVVRFDTGLPLLIAVMNGNRSFEVSLRKVVTLEGDDRRRQQIRREARWERGR